MWVYAYEFRCLKKPKASNSLGARIIGGWELSSVCAGSSTLVFFKSSPHSWLLNHLSSSLGESFILVLYLRVFVIYVLCLLVIICVHDMWVAQIM